MARALVLLVSLAGCARGWMQTVTIGPTFTSQGHAGVVVALEVSAIAHERFVPRAPRQQLVTPDDHGPPRYVGIAATAGAGGLFGGKLGASAFASAGVDLLPMLFESGGLVGFGAHVADAAGAQHGIHAVAPRLWFAIPLAHLAGAPLTAGLMLRCLVGLGDASGCGPSLVVSRVAL
jgi:hypothetical protein